MILTRPIVFFDLETTGVKVNEDRIIEISMIKVFPNGRPEEVRTKLVNPTIPIPREASEIHDIWDVDVADAPTFTQISKGVLAFIEDCDLGGYNSNIFDVKILFYEFFRAGITWDYKKHNFIDVCVIFKRKEERTLSAAVNFYLERKMEDAHSAEADVSATIDVFEAQLKKYEDLPEDISELALFCNYDKTTLDLSGNFTLDSEDNVIFTFGKHKDKKAKENKDYLRWMLESDFMPDTKQICKEILKS